jgi:hypothetical protein
MGTEDLPRNIFQVACLAIKIMGISMKVPNPSGGFGTFSEGTVEVSGLAPFLEGSWDRIGINRNFYFRLSFGRTNCHEGTPLSTMNFKGFLL